MRFSFITKLLSFLLVLSAVVLADTWTTSFISSDVSWVKDNTSGDGVYVVDLSNDTLIVNSGVTLTIEPGVTVKFHDDIIFLVYGTLVAQGTVNDSIRFISDDAAGSTGEWGGIKLISTSGSYANLLAYCRIEDGDADNTGLSSPEDSKNGGAIYFGANILNNTEVTNCTIQNNSAYEGGGGMAFAGSPVVNNCLVQNNSAGQYGGGISIKGPTPTTIANPVLGNMIIIHNTANGFGGGGIGLFSGADLTMTHGLVQKNTASNGPGGGIYFGSPSTTGGDISNSVIGQNSADSDPQIYGTANISYSDIEGGYSGLGNIDEDPAFIDPDNDNYHFEATSALVDAGDNSTSLAIDYDGIDRPYDGDRNSVAVVDIGPFEYVNTAPQINSTPLTDATEDEPYSYQVTSEDPDLGEILTYSLLESPSFVSINGATGEVSGLPIYDSHAGANNIVIQVADLNADTSTQQYTLNVAAVNDQPVVTDIGNQDILEGQTFSTINLDEYVTDEESLDAEINWNYSGNIELSVSIINRIATITMPDTNWYGSETITFTASDPGEQSDYDEAVFTVTNINDAPVILDIPDQEIVEGASFTQINLDDYVNDVDNVKSDLNWSFTGDSELNVSIDENRVATISALDEDWFGSEIITFTVVDPGGLDDEDAVTFNITAVNDAPLVEGIPDQEIAEGQSFTTINLDDYVTDIDDEITSLTWSHAGNVILNVSIDENFVATITTADTNWYGSETITFIATDTSNDSGMDDAFFSITNVNDAPVVSQIPDQTIDEGSGFDSINLNDYVLDVDNLDEAINWTATGNTDLIVTIDEFNQVSITMPDVNWFGSESITFTASDPGLLSDDSQATFSVTAVNDAPLVANIPDQTITEGGTFAVFDLDTLVSDVDDADDQLSWTFSGNAELTVDIDENNRVTVSIPGSNWNGSEEITFTATDTSGAESNDAAIFTVNPENDPPVVSTIPGQVVAEGESSSTINLNSFVTDPDNEDAEISWTVSGNSALQVSIDAQNQAIVNAIDPDWFGAETIQFRASDPEGLADSTSAEFTMTAVNDAPVVANIPDQTIIEDGTFADFDLDTLVNDVDDADDQLSWMFSGNTELTVIIDGNNLVTISNPGNNWNGSEEITFTATDTSGAESSDVAIFTVNPENDPPVVSTIPGQEVAEVASFTIIDLNNYVSDPDNEISEMDWTVSGDSALHVSIDPQNLATVSAIDSNWFGSESLQFIASDPEGLSDSVFTVFSKTPVNDAPVLAIFPEQITAEGQAFAPIYLDDFVVDVDDADSTLSWDAAYYLNISVVIEDRILSVSVLDPEWNGSNLVMLYVNDPAGLQDSMSVLFTVNAVNDPPIFSASVPDLSFVEDDSLDYQITNWYAFAEDADNPDSTLMFAVFGSENILVSKLDTVYRLKSNPNWFGIDSLLLTVTDGESIDSTYIDITVFGCNDPPEIVNLPQKIIFDNDLGYELNLFDFMRDVDTPDSLLQWAFQKDEDSLLVELNDETGHLSLTIIPYFTGIVQAVFSLTDDSAATVYDTVEVIVRQGTAIEDYLADQIPTENKLNQNYPNPFNPSTAITYQLKEISEVELSVFNILGQKIVTLVQEKQKAGYYRYTWDGASYANGVYFYRIQAGTYNRVHKMILMK